MRLDDRRFFLDAVEGMRQSGDSLKGLGNATAIQ